MNLNSRNLNLARLRLKKLTIILIIALFGGITPVFSQKISVDFENVTLKQAVEVLQTKYFYSFSMNIKNIDLNKRINYKAKDVELTDVVNKIFKDQGLTCIVKDKIINIVKSDKNSDNQNEPSKDITLKGKVLDENSEPIIGASVVIKGTTIGTITNLDGDFEIKVNTAQSVLVSFIGYDTQEFVVGDIRSLNIALVPSMVGLNEVVVTALGIKRSKKTLSYNVQDFKSNELTTVKDANLMNSLTGKIAGVNINASSSGTGGATRVVMRGVKSISANNNALYVIDGVPIFNSNNGATTGEYSLQPGGEGISDINPEDIESLSVLSGPAAAALYGSSAAQGVIMITTKKGKAGDLKLSVSNSTTFSSPFIMPDFQNVYGNKPGEFKSWGDKLDTPSSFNPEKFFNTGFNTQTNVSLSIGNEKNQTYMSLGTTNSEGLITNNEYNRYNFTFRNTTNFLNDKLLLDVGLSYIMQDHQNLMAQGEYWNPLITTYLFPRGENFDDVRLFERFDEGRHIYTQHWPWGLKQNPYWIANRNVRSTKKHRYMMNASLKYKMADWINVAGRVRIDNSVSDNEDKRYASTAGLFAGPKGLYSFSKGDQKQVYGDVIININKDFEDFSINANVGGSGTYLSSNTIGYKGALRDMPNLFNYYNIDPDGRDSYPIQGGWEESTLSLFMSSEIGWKNLLYLTVTGRNDWASALAETEENSFFYPSVGLSGIVSEMVDLPKAISYLKVRGSWASVGSAISRGLSQPRYRYDVATKKWATNTFRPLGKLYPERTNSWETGLTANLFKNKLNFDVTYYTSNTKKQTFNIPVSASGGYSSMYIQAGNVRNYGMEVSLGGNFKTNSFSWKPTLTYSFNRNEIIELLDNYEDPLTDEVYSLDQISVGGIGAASIILKKGGTMGDLYVSTDLERDAEGNIWIDPSTNNVVKKQLKDPVKVGSVLPDGNLGFRNDFNYKNLNFGFMFSARLGGVVVSQTQATLDEYGVSKTTAEARENGGIWINNGYIDAEKYYNEIGGKNGLLSRYVYSATNVRLQEAYIGFNMPKKWFNDKFDINCSIIGRNLLMLFNKAPFDPESTPSTGTFMQGMDLFMQPSMQSYGFNVKVNF